MQATEILQILSNQSIIPFEKENETYVPLTSGDADYCYVPLDGTIVAIKRSGFAPASWEDFANAYQLPVETLASHSMAGSVFFLRTESPIFRRTHSLQTGFEIICPPTQNQVRWATVPLTNATLGGELATISTDAAKRIAATSSARVSSVVVQKLSEITPSKTEWLWDGFIPVGYLASLTGNGGIGKTTLLTKVMADLSVGKKPFSNVVTQSPAKCLYVTGETSFAETLLPNLTRFGGNPDQVLVTKYVSMSDADVVEDLITTHEISLLVFDPIQQYMDCDSFRGDQTRKILAPLQEVAERTRCAILLVRHRVKSEKIESMHSGQGSADIYASVRCDLSLTKVSDTERELRSNKNNLRSYGDTFPSALRIEENETGLRLAGKKNIDETISEMLQNPMLSVDFLSQLSNEGFSQREITAAKKKNNVVSYQISRKHWVKIEDK